MQIGASFNVNNVKHSETSANKPAGELKQTEKKEDSSLAALLEDIESSITADVSDTARSIRG